MAGTKDAKKPYYEMISERLIKQLEEGTAPWQKPWEPGIQRMPHNPVSGTRYKGANALWLSMQGRSDPRWMTYKQANSVNTQVMKGEKGTIVQYWKFRDRVPKKENGKPVLDAEGKKVMINIELDKPKVFSAVVFNAEQIQGLPPLEAKQTIPEWERHERAEAILSASGANINHDQGDRAFYSPVRDSIHLPEKSQFESSDRYYATALHELGHWTGHPSRLNRDLSGRFGSESYAAEELRAEIASMGIGEELEIGHDPGQHASYVKSWIKVLKNDPKEILRSARDAEKIHDMVMGFERDRDQKQDNQAMVSPAAAEKLHKLDRNAVEGYSPLESWKMMQAEAASNGYKALINLNKDHGEFASTFVIDYQDKEGADTGIQTNLYADSKMETSIHGRRLSKFISNDSESQPRHLHEAFQEHEAGKTIQPPSEGGKVHFKPQEAETDPKQGKDSTLPLKLAEKYAQNFASEADRDRFLERVQDRLNNETGQTVDIRIRESVARDADSDFER